MILRERGYYRLKAEAINRTVLGIRLVRGYKPVVRQIAE